MAAIRFLGDGVASNGPNVGNMTNNTGSANSAAGESFLPLTATVSDIQRITTAEPDTFAEILQFHVKTMADIGKIAASTSTTSTGRVSGSAVFIRS